MTTKIKDIRIWYKFRPNLDIWFKNRSGKSYAIKLYDETYYGGGSFLNGFFAFINFRLFSMHIIFSWWKINL